MSSSSSDEDFNQYHRPYPLHDAAEAGDMETLASILKPQRKPKKSAAAAAAEVGTQKGGVVAMDEDGVAGDGQAGDGGELGGAREASNDMTTCLGPESFC